MRRRLLIYASALALGSLLVGLVTVAINWRGLRDYIGGTSGVAVFRQHSASVTCVAFSPDGAMLASGSADRTVRLWSLAAGQDDVVFRAHGSPVASVAFAPDGKTIAWGKNDGAVELWELDKCRQRLLFRVPPFSRYPISMSVCSIGFGSDGKTLVGGVNNADQEHGALRGDVILWDVKTGAVTRRITRLLSCVPRIALTPDGKTLAVSDGRQVRLLEPSTGGERPPLEFQGGITALALSGDGKTLAVVEVTGDSTGQPVSDQVLLWDLVAGGQVGALQRQAVRITALAFAAQAGRLVTGSEDGTVKLWDVAGGKELLSLREHDGTVNSVAITADGKKLASGGKDGTVRLWDVPKLLKQRADKE